RAGGGREGGVGGGGLGGGGGGGVERGHRLVQDSALRVARRVAHREPWLGGRGRQRDRNVERDPQPDHDGLDRALRARRREHRVSGVDLRELLPDAGQRDGVRILRVFDARATFSPPITAPYPIQP